MDGGEGEVFVGHSSTSSLQEESLGQNFTILNDRLTGVQELII